jgi:hypothetical protein
MPTMMLCKKSHIILVTWNRLKFYKMRWVLVFCCFSLFGINAFSQKTIDVDKDPNANGGILQNVYAVGGKPFVTAKFSKLIEGSPFFDEQMMRGTIILSDGKEHKDHWVRLNLLESQVNYLGDKQIEMIATSPIKEVVLSDTIQKINHHFIFSEFINLPEKPEKDFYELLETGKTELYKQYKKKLLESRPYGSSTTEQKIQTEIRYFLLLNGQWIRIKKLKDLTAAFYRKKNEIANFITEKNISGDSESNFQTVTTYYNSLFTKQ